MELFEVVAGTYEEFLLGYKFNDDTLVQSFASHDHSSSIRSLATCDNYLASGAADDRIIVYDMVTRKEHCMLTHHNSTINCMQFTKEHSHLLSGSADGVLAIVKTGSWALEKIWDKAHKGMAIYDIAVHPTGKLALTLGADTTLRTWNLIKGRQAYAINLNSKSKDAKSLERIMWAEDGIRFLLYGGTGVEIWSIEIGGILKVIPYNSKVCSAIWLSNNEIIIGGENGSLCIIDINNDSKNITSAHKSRVKALSKYGQCIVSATSSGEIKMWSTELKEKASINSGCRITCIVLINSITMKKEEEKIEVVEKIKTKPQKIKPTVIVEVEEDSSFKGLKGTFTDKGVKKKKRKKRNIDEVVQEQSIDETFESVTSKKKKKKHRNTGGFEQLTDVTSEKRNNKKKKKKQNVETTEFITLYEAESLSKKVNLKRNKKQSH